MMRVVDPVTTLHLLVDVIESTDLRVELQPHQFLKIFALLRMLRQSLVRVAHFLDVALDLHDQHTVALSSTQSTLLHHHTSENRVPRKDHRHM